MIPKKGQIWLHKEFNKKNRKFFLISEVCPDGLFRILLHSDNEWVHWKVFDYVFDVYQPLKEFRGPIK